MIRTFLPIIFFGWCFSYSQPKTEKSKANFNSVSGAHPIDSMGLTPIHKHILLDLIGAVRCLLIVMISIW